MGSASTTSDNAQPAPVRQLSKRDRVLVLAITVVAFAIIFRPTIAYLNFWRGDQFAMTGDLTDSVGAFRKSILLDPGRVPPRLALAGAYRGLGDSKAAEREWRGVLKLDPRNAEARFFLGLAAFKAHDYRDSERHFLRAIGQRNDFSMLSLRMLALTYEKQGRIEDAIRTWQRLKRQFSRTPRDADRNIDRLKSKLSVKKGK